MANCSGFCALACIEFFDVPPIFLACFFECLFLCDTSGDP